MPPHTEEWDAKEYDWKNVAAAELLCPSACDFIYAKFSPTETAGGVTIRNGENTNGEVLVIMLTAGAYNCEVSPRRPIYCRRGIYVDTITTGTLLVQWRPRSSQEG